MLRSRFTRRIGNTCRHPNFAACIVSAATIGFLSLNWDARTADADRAHRSGRVPRTGFVPAAGTARTGGATLGTAAASGSTDTRTALLLQLALLRQAHDRLARTPSYTATFVRQERVGGTLLDEERIDLKVGHEPFSVYMKWLTGDAGREVVYVDGQNDGNLAVHLGGWKAKLLTLNLEPTSDRAMSGSRHPVTMAGLKRLVETMLEHRTHDLAASDAVSCTFAEDDRIGNRACLRFVIEHADPAGSPEYRKSIVHLDAETGYPLAVRSFGWPTASDAELAGAELDEATLVEAYAYDNLRVDAGLTALDFDRANPGYSFRN